MRNALEELEKWKYGHKARWVQIEHADGYGSSSWTVEIGGEKGVILTGIEGYWDGENGPVTGLTIKEGSPPYLYVWDTENDDWPGLSAVILATLDQWQILYDQKK